MPCAYFYIMEVTFSSLRQKEVINLVDGSNLGRVCDISFLFPENEITGFTVTGGRGLKFFRQEIFLPINCVQKIGEDAVLVKFSKSEGSKPPKKPLPPDKCPPPNDMGPCPPRDRRSYDEYE